MKFNIDLVTKSSGRLGSIQRLEKGVETAIRTPAVIMATKVSDTLSDTDLQ